MRGSGSAGHAEPGPARRKLPIGVQTFREIRKDRSYYVDKTPFIRRLVDEGKHYFLSRPRRFGKSLLVDTIKELFEGNEPLFRGLAVHDEWNWSVRRPVLRFDFSQGDCKQADYLHANVSAQLDRAERTAAVASRYSTAPEVQGLVVRDRHADVPAGHAGEPGRQRGGSGRHAVGRRTALRFRRGRHRPRSAAFPDRLPDHPRRRKPRRAELLPAGLSEPRGAAKPERQPAAAPAGPVPPGCPQHPPAQGPAGQRLRRPGVAVQGVVRGHPLPVAHEERHRRL